MFLLSRCFRCPVFVVVVGGNIPLSVVVATLLLSLRFFFTYWLIFAGLQSSLYTCVQFVPNSLGATLGWQVG